MHLYVYLLLGGIAAKARVQGGMGATSPPKSLEHKRTIYIDETIEVLYFYN